MHDDDFAGWFRLLETPGIGRATARALLAAFGSPAAVLGASPAQWRAVGGEAAAAALASNDADDLIAQRLAVAQAWRLGDPSQRHILTLGDPSFPPLLLQTADPPLLLYVQGDSSLLARDSIAIVGSRNGTPQGLDNARHFARFIGDAGWLIVSGMALGIDAAAHEGALASSSPTVAVVGTGLDIVYPSRHRALAHRIAASGAIVSEFAPGTPAMKENFPRRNRLIAGLTRGTLVVEAALQSGSLITARQAAEAGREVFAIPGSIHAPQARGCHALIKQGAKLVEAGADILEELEGVRRDVSPVTESEAPAALTDPILDAMGHDPVTIDAIGARTGFDAATLAAKLLDLELQGQVARLPGALYQRRAGA